MSDKDTKITKEDIIDKYAFDNDSMPEWANKKFKEMTTDEINTYKKYRKLIEKEKKGGSPKVQVVAEEPIEEPVAPIPVPKVKEEQHSAKQMAAGDLINESTENPEEFYATDNKWSNDDKMQLVSHTTQKVAESLLSPEEKEILDKQRTQDAFIEDYIKNHQIKDQAHMNYAVEHDMKFRSFLEKTGRINDVYTGKHIEEMKRRTEEVNIELEKEAKKDTRNKIVKRFDKLKPEKKVISNNLKDSKKELDLTAYRNKKMDAQGFILCMYLRKNGRMDMRYVKMDEVGQIKVDGYVYHERDGTYRFGKKNDPVLVIMEGALVPLSKETLKEHLGMESAEAQKLVIKGIEQAEVVKAGGLDDNLKKPFTPNKWIVGVVVVIIIGIYAYMGGFS